ncbi:MAG: DUF4114 domain-containing protein [Bacteroidota bacterium]|nr:DUF4114 domain-containing protein [Bacteroidota bacterium]
MKNIRYITILLGISLFAACKKDAVAPVTVPVEFPGTSYQFLGTFDSLGKPDYLLPREQISASLLSYINSILINNKNLNLSHPELLNNPAIADIVITQTSDVFITFIQQGAGQANALGFYTYPTGHSPATAEDIKVITYVFPSVGAHSPLKAGDKVKIGKFEAGTSIGFVLMRGAWNASTGTLNNKVVHFCSNDALNPEVDPKLKKHAVLINYPPENKILVGFEDTDRTVASCDNDFNDVEFYCSVVF